MATTRHQIFLIQPFDKSSEGVYELIRAAASAANAGVARSDSLTRADSGVVESIHSAIQAASLVVADVTNGNPNVMYELGFAQALGKPLLIVASSSRSVPFDLARVRVVIYDVANPNEFVERLARSITQALKDPEAFRFALGAAEREGGPRVFLSYSHTDREYVDRLLVHLKRSRKKASLTCG